MIETDQPSAQGIHVEDGSLVVRCKIDEDIGVDQVGHSFTPVGFLAVDPRSSRRL
jgi:hypothetical protein